MLKDTGERVIPEKMSILNGLLLEHLARYHFSAHYVYGRVLDFASGSGYGTHIIAKQCKDKVDEVVGVDINQDAVNYAKAKYYHPISSFIEGDVVDPTLPEVLGEFDCILSFETLEHIHEEEQFMKNIYKMLKPGGALILSTPFGEGRGIPSGQEFHVHQLTVKEFKELFNDYQTKEFYYQKGVVIEPAQSSEEKNYPLGIAVCKK
ncbi:class I SAM-dependent methyltransferase [Ornithinibacillus halophilus]|uniref:Methyltransferase domain-containing protein n=1 Tax=Ornithinibacillus halophilus TaxID=930117 RepID=A0A1M5E022_9BACI|nr:class I SAM-dependent methyltransferase [Ornithinibacillus halophilus]SHF72598.1 Methyltransferase domain-containing protein [Ornithinibacillus halophilus]